MCIRDRYKDLADCDLIVEAVLEKMEVKKELFTTLDEICKDSCIFGSNTSSLSITEIATGIKHNVIGMHFFNPADRMKLVEVISGINTPVETKEAIIEISRSLGKTPVEVAEGPGSVSYTHLDVYKRQALVSLFFCLYAFDDDCSTLSAADAQGSQSDFQIALLHFMKQTHQNSVSGCTDRMSQCDCSAIDVGFFHKGVTIHAGCFLQFMNDTQRLCSKRFIQLYELHVLDAQVSILQRMQNRRRRTKTHDAWIYTALTLSLIHICQPSRYWKVKKSLHWKRM